jgi:hypothetical protein
MNNRLINSIVQIVHSLSPEEQAIVREKLSIDDGYPCPQEIIYLALQGNSFDFLNNEPDLLSVDCYNDV